MIGPPADHGREPRVFTIAPGVPFLPTLADALLDGTLVPGFPDSIDPLALSTATIFLPTRRAARALTSLLASRAGATARLLPRIVPLGDADDAELVFGDGDLDPETHAALPPSIGELERRLVLTQLILAFARAFDRAHLKLAKDETLLVPSSPADAYALAGDLARLMDQLTTEGVAWEKLAGIVEERYDRYFSLTLEFLEIAAKTWPRYLDECGAIDPVRRRNLVLQAAAERLARQGPGSGPLIAAGSTGSVPAVARLIAAISRAPRGAVVLPGLDTTLDPETWDTLSNGSNREPAHGHPQLAIHRLLAAIGTTRDVVRSLGSPSPVAAARNRFLGEALRPAVTTERWAPRLRDPGEWPWREALHDLALVVAADEREEALVASVAIREALETEGATAALVTPDRGIAERVAVELKRWSIDVEDSAGVPLARTLPGRLALLAASCALSEHAPRELVALLAHPFVTLGWRRGDVEAAASALEIGVLRGPAPPAGLAGLRSVVSERKVAAQLRYAPLPAKRLTARDWERIEALIDRLDWAFAVFRLERERTHDFVELASRHRAALAALTEVGPGEPDQLAAAEAGAALDEMFDELALCGTGRVIGSGAQYPAFLAALAGERPVRRPAGQGRVHIWGLLEARLLDADFVVAGGLDEGVWPPVVKTDAFLNRPMRASLGLEPPERRIGQTAHDLVSALGGQRVVITRSLKREGAPTVPSRFIQRMAAVAGERSWKAAVAAGERYRVLAKALDRRDARVRAVPRPAPKPPRDLVPRSLSVTEIETLVRDPYSIFARHVLRLDQLEGLAVEPGAADRGTIVHGVIGRFTAEHPRELPPDALERILDAGKQAFAVLAASPGLAAQWWPRFARMAEAFLRWDALRRPVLANVYAEVSGTLEIPLASEETFTLRARADRIEQHRDGSFTVVDFKTGTPPSPKVVFAGFAPQLTLEAAMLARGAFQDIGRAGRGSTLLYLHATGGTPPVVPCPIEPPPGETRSVAAIIEQHLAKLETLMGRYVSGQAGFMARPYAQYARRFNEYDHLARTREWSLAADEAEDLP